MSENDNMVSTRTLTALLFVFISFAGIGFSIYVFTVAHSIYTYIVAIMLLSLAIVSAFFNLLSSFWYYKSSQYSEHFEEIKKGLKPMKNMPSVSIVMPTHDEDIKMIAKNVRALKKLSYQRGKAKIYLLNDSPDPKTKESLSKLCSKLGISFIYRSDNIGYKAGALNNFLKYSKEEFIAIFDADELLIDHNFLMDGIPFFQDEKVSYVQTEKRYSKGTLFSDSIDVFDGFFFKFVEPARMMNNTAIFAGSCGIIRRAVLDQMKGFPEYVIEDTFFSFESDMRGYKGIYIPKVYAIGKPIDTFSKLVKQQWRYNYGDTQFIAYFFKKKGYKKKSHLQSMNYMAHGFGLNYLSIILIMFTFVSIAIVFSSLPFAHINILNGFNFGKLDFDLEALGILTAIMSLAVPVILTKIYFNSFKKGFMIFMLNYALAFVRARAAIATLLNKYHFKWTNKNEVNNRFIVSITKAKAEIAFSGVLVAFSIIALSKSNTAGGLWLLWYGVMYCLAPIFFYKYG